MEGHPSPIAGKPARRSPWNKGKIIGAKPPLIGTLVPLFVSSTSPHRATDQA